MKALRIFLAVAISAPLVVACERHVETETKVKTEDGRTKVEKKTVTETPSGDVTVTKERREVGDR